MSNVPKKVRDRLSSALKIISTDRAAKRCVVNVSDTVTSTTNMLGYDK
jgi:hypothetical protein